LIFLLIRDLFLQQIKYNSILVFHISSKIIMFLRH